MPSCCLLYSDRRNITVSHLEGKRPLSSVIVVKHQGATFKITMTRYVEKLCLCHIFLVITEHVVLRVMSFSWCRSILPVVCAFQKDSFTPLCDDELSSSPLCFNPKTAFSFCVIFPECVLRVSWRLRWVFFSLLWFDLLFEKDKISFKYHYCFPIWRVNGGFFLHLS